MMRDAVTHAASPMLACRSPFVALPEDELEAFCRRWKVDGLRLVGSALRGPFHDQSDIDLVIRASIRSPIYATRNQRPCLAAIDELRGLLGRKVDLVCPRRVLAGANPYSIYNLLVDHQFDRDTCRAWYLRSVAQLLAHAALPSPEASLAAMPARHLVLVALIRLARHCESESRIADLRRQGLTDVPFEAVKALIGPVLASMQAQQRPRWPDDAALAQLIMQLAPHLAHIDEVTARLLPAKPPELPRAQIEQTLVDPPLVWGPPSADRRPGPTFAFQGERLALDPGESRDAYTAWGVLTMFVPEAGANRDERYPMGDIVCFALTHQPVTLTASQIEPSALIAVRALVRHNARLLAKQRLAVGGPLLYSVLVRATFAGGATN